MRITELPTFLADELTYPIERTAVIEEVGSIEIEAPDQPDTETIETVIGDVGERRYDSADELFETILGNLSDEYIGRKFYDDRGRTPSDSSSGPSDEVDVSF